MKKRMLGMALALLMVPGLLAGCKNSPSTPAGETSPPAAQSSGIQSETPDDSNTEDPAPSYANPGLPEEMRGMWLAYTDVRREDIATEEKYRAYLAQVLDDCEYMGLNTLFFVTRPFSDAMYASAHFPWSSLITGTQGQAPGFDPLAIAVAETHARGMRIEAYLNPYRVKVSDQIPGALSADNAAVENPNWAHQVGASMWYDPGLPEVQQLVINGVREIVENYDVDGIHFDDYFYPSFANAEDDEAFDAVSYDMYGAGMDRAAWRRQNVNTLVAQVYAMIKEVDTGLSFGISPQGNNDNNYNGQYSDVKLWMAEPGYVDYVMPQIYWGFGWLNSSGSNYAAFDVKCAEWAGFARLESVKLYVGLAPYRVYEGNDGSAAGDPAEWTSGHAMADQIAHARTVNGMEGYALFSYWYLTDEAGPLPVQEAAAIAEANRQ